MFKLEPVIESRIDFGALSRCINLTEADKHSSSLHAKLAYVTTSMFSLEIWLKLYSITFYFYLPEDLITDLINLGLKVQLQTAGRISKEGFITGTLYEYREFVHEACKQEINTELRKIGNLFYTILNDRFGLFNNEELKHLPDKTFQIK